MKADYGVFKKEYRGTGLVDEKVPFKMLVGGLVLEVVTSAGVTSLLLFLIHIASPEHKDYS